MMDASVDTDDEKQEALVRDTPVVPQASGVPMSTTLYLQWRCSYRRSEPERPNREAIRKSLMWKQKFFMHLDLPVAQRAPAPQYEPEWEERRRSQRKAIENRSNREFADAEVDPQLQLKIED